MALQMNHVWGPLTEATVHIYSEETLAVLLTGKSE